MTDAQDQGHTAWRAMQHEWLQVQAQWGGITVERFAAHFWTQLEEETMDYLRALDDLIETLQDARRDVQQL